MLTGQKDQDFLIMSKLDDKSLINFCLAGVDSYTRSLCRDETFWRNRTLEKYGDLKKYGKLEKSSHRTWKNLYLTIIHYMEKYDLEDGLIEASKEGDLDLVKFFI